MEVLLTNVTNPGEINHIKIGDVLKLTLRTRPLQKILVSNGQISSELGQTDKTGKLEKEITITEKEIGSWRQDFTTADNSDTGSVCFLVLGPNGETGKESPKEESIIPLVLLGGVAAFFFWLDFKGGKSPLNSFFEKPKVAPLGDELEPEEDEPEEEELEEEEPELVER